MLPSGIPVIKLSPESQRTQDAIAKARKIVEADQKEDAAKDAEKKNVDEMGAKPEESVKADVEVTVGAGEKREREGDDGKPTETKKSKVDGDA